MSLWHSSRRSKLEPRGVVNENIHRDPHWNPKDVFHAEAHAKRNMQGGEVPNNLCRCESFDVVWLFSKSGSPIQQRCYDGTRFNRHETVLFGV